MIKKKGIFKACVLLMLVLSMVLNVPMEAKADFGDYNDYDSGSDWSSSSDWDSSYDWDDDWDDDYSYSSSGSGSGGSASPVMITIWLIIILVIMIHSKKNKQITKAKTNVSKSVRKANITLPNRTEQISNIVKQHDEFFSAPDFISYAKKVFMDIQTAWEQRDLEPVRGVMHQHLYQQTKRQVDKKIADGVINHLERITISSCYLTSYRRDEQYEYLGVYLASSMIDYQVKEATGEVILGDKTTRWPMFYKMTFMRSDEAKTAVAKDEEQDFMCPNCGAPMEGTSFGVCEYCGSTVTVDAHDWVLADFGAIKDMDVDEGIQNNSQ